MAVFADGFDSAAAVRSRMKRSTTRSPSWTFWNHLSASRSSPPPCVLGHVRFGMLETIRQFATERLDAMGPAGRAGSPCPLLRRAKRSSSARSGTGPAAHRPRVGRGRVRQPAKWLPMGDGRRRPRDCDLDRCPERHDGVSPAALRTRRMGRGDPPRRPSCRPSPASPALQCGRLVRTYRPARAGIEYAEASIALEADSRDTSPPNPAGVGLGGHRLRLRWSARALSRVCALMAPTGPRSRHRYVRPDDHVARPWSGRRGDGHRRRNRMRRASTRTLLDRVRPLRICPRLRAERTDRALTACAKVSRYSLEHRLAIMNRGSPVMPPARGDPWAGRRGSDACSTPRSIRSIAPGIRLPSRLRSSPWQSCSSASSDTRLLRRLRREHLLLTRPMVGRHPRHRRPPGRGWRGALRPIAALGAAMEPAEAVRYARHQIRLAQRART